MRHRAPVVYPTTVKHFVALTNAGQASGAVAVHQVVNALALGATINTTDDIIEGTLVQAVHVEYWLNNRGTDTTQFTLIVVKIPSNAANPTVTNMLNLQAYLNKKNILYTTQGNIGEKVNQSIPILNQWLLIPKGKQRFGLGDRLITALLPTGQEIDWCGMAIFKAKT